MPRTVFISHAHKDNALCAQIAQGLRQRGVDAWIDLTNMQDGHSLSGDITSELLWRQVFVLLLTGASNASHWVDQELDTFTAFVNDRQTRLVDGVERVIIPVLLEANLPMLAHDSATQRERASNWAKTFRLKAIDGINQPPTDVVAMLAHALGIDLAAATAEVVVPPPLPLIHFPIPTHLARLGFTGDVRNGVEVIVPPLCPVPSGTFTMGSDKQYDPQANDNEMPQYDIFVPAFQIGMYPLTVAEYTCAVKAGKVTAPASLDIPKDAAWAAPAMRGTTLSWQAQQQRPDHPVVCITWQQARAYATWLALVTGQPWRLPSEAEWEKAAHWDAAKQVARIYPWGDAWGKAKANTNDGGPKTTTPVGAYVEQGDASPYGAHEMAGNVWEWTSSIYQERPPYRADQAEKDADTTSPRVLRGGSWYGSPRYARAAYRVRNVPVNIISIIGVRLVFGSGDDR